MEQFVNSLLDNCNLPVLTAFLLGILTSVSPCTFTTNVMVLGYIGRDMSGGRRVFANGLFYTLGRIVSYTVLGLICIPVLKKGASTFFVQSLVSDYGGYILAPTLIVYGVFLLLGSKFPFGKFGFRASESSKRLRGSFGAFVLGLLFALAGPLTELLYRSEQAGRLLRVFAPLALVLYMDALTDGMLKGLSEQVANVRYNTLTSALDAALLVLLLPRWGLDGYIFAFAATHLLNFALSLRRLLLVTGCPFRLGAALGISGCAAAGALAAQLLPGAGEAWISLGLRAAVFSGVFVLAACLSGTAERCLPPSLRELLHLPERGEKTQALR